MGVMGPGKEIDCDLPFDKLDTLEFMEKLYDLIISRKGVGDDMAEGFYRAAKRWGRLEKDLGTNLLYYAYWGMPTHSSYDPRAEVHWGYGTILGDRDINEHDFCFIFWKNFTTKGNPPLDAETLEKKAHDMLARLGKLGEALDVRVLPTESAVGGGAGAVLAARVVDDADRFRGAGPEHMAYAGARVGPHAGDSGVGLDQPVDGRHAAVVRAHAPQVGSDRDSIPISRALRFRVDVAELYPQPGPGVGCRQSLRAGRGLFLADDDWGHLGASAEGRRAGLGG
jgi:hypothetical protein